MASLFQVNAKNLLLSVDVTASWGSTCRLREIASPGPSCAQSFLHGFPDAQCPIRFPDWVIYADCSSKMRNDQICQLKVANLAAHPNHAHVRCPPPPSLPALSIILLTFSHVLQHSL